MLKSVSNGIRLAGSVVFGDRNGQTFSTALPLVADLKQALLFSQVASNASFFTGYAILNPNESDANATFELFDTDGVLIDRQIKTIPARQRQIMLLTDIFPRVAYMDSVSGYVRVTSDKPIAAFSIYGTNSMSAICAVPAQDIP